LPKKGPDTPSATIDKIERNTRETVDAINNQTNQLLSLDSRLLNVPSSFTVPAYRPLGVGSGGSAPVTNNIHIAVTEASNARETANEVMRQISSAMRREGSYATPRY
jgi:hypothetical protein